MYERLIINYLNNLQIEDIKRYAFKYNYIINDKDCHFLYNFVKKYYKDLIYGDESFLDNKLKGKIDKNLYQELLILYRENKKKYFN